MLYDNQMPDGVTCICGAESVPHIHNAGSITPLIKKPVQGITFLELHWHPGLEEQCQSRLYRPIDPEHMPIHLPVFDNLILHALGVSWNESE